MAQLNIGWSEVSITPDKKVSLAGQFAERISEYVEKPCTVTAMAVEAGGDQMILVSCDLVAIGWNLTQLVREEVKKANANMVSYKSVGSIKIRDTEFPKNTSRKITRFAIDKTVE
jgi:hypothetical protein